MAAPKIHRYVIGGYISGQWLVTTYELPYSSQLEMMVEPIPAYLPVTPNTTYTICCYD